MALDTFVEGASSERLESSLRYPVPRTPSAIVSSRAATVSSAGGDSYSTANGVRAITYRIQGSGGAAGSGEPGPAACATGDGAGEADALEADAAAAPAIPAEAQAYLAGLPGAEGGPDFDEI